MSFLGPLIPFLDFWWHLLWASKSGQPYLHFDRVIYRCAYYMFPEIHLLGYICWPLGGQLPPGQGTPHTVASRGEAVGVETITLFWWLSMLKMAISAVLCGLILIYSFCCSEACLVSFFSIKSENDFSVFVFSCTPRRVVHFARSTELLYSLYTLIEICVII